MALRKTIMKARDLRRSMTPPEVRLWSVLRTRPGGLRFRRQHPVGPFVLDFYCAATRVAIEVDGIAHDMGSNPARDERRDRWLAEQGIHTLRIPAVEVEAELEAVVRMIIERCAIPLHHPTGGPPPRASRRED